MKRGSNVVEREANDDDGTSRGFSPDRNAIVNASWLVAAFGSDRREGAATCETSFCTAH